MFNTETKIKEAALRVFSEKGYASTKTRDIASSAGVNVSTLHYHYRSKDKLFKVISDEVFSQFNKISDEVFEADISFDEKIKSFVSRYTDFCKLNPQLPSFIVFESERNPELVYGNIDFKKFDSKIESELKELISKGKIHPITYPDFILNLVSLTIFPFLNRHMLHRVNGLSNEELDALLERRKEMIPKMIIDSIYIESN